MLKDNRFSFFNRARAFGFAVSGLVYAFKIGHALWLQSLAAGLIILAGLYFHISASDWRWIVLCITLVWTAEIMNTAIELVCDALHPDHHPVIGHAKDAAAGAVLMAAIGAAIIGALVFWPYLF
jgi:diacylglycerol kinase (ATP)